GASSRRLKEIEAEVRRDVREAAEIARRAPKPTLETGVKRPLPALSSNGFIEGRDDAGSPPLTMLEAIQSVLHARMHFDHRVTLFGEDIEDPKGDVFGVTKGLSSAFPERVHNSPLSESTIVGVSIGQALAGARPVAFIQFADFLPLAFNQIISELGSMYWRTS